MIQFLDALAIFFIITTGAVGFRRGLLEELGRLLGLIFATIGAAIGTGNIWQE